MHEMCNHMRWVCKCAIHAIIKMLPKIYRKCLVNMQSVPKEYLLSPITALLLFQPLCKCNRCETFCIPFSLFQSHFHDVDFSHGLTFLILAHLTLFSLTSNCSLSVRFYMFSHHLVEREIYVCEILVEFHFAYHSKYLYSFVSRKSRRARSTVITSKKAASPFYVIKCSHFACFFFCLFPDLFCAIYLTSSMSFSSI